MSALVNKLIRIASSQGISQKELADKSGISRENISRMKNRSANLASVERIADTLGYSVAVIKRSPLPRLDHAISAWSSPAKRNDKSMLHARMANASFKDLLELTELHGVRALEKALEDIKPEIGEPQYRLEKEMLNNIKTAYA